MSGATYQSEVAAYLVVQILCEVDAEVFGSARPRSLSFETANPVDDINIVVEERLNAFVQVKRKLAFSLNKGSELYGCLEQFVRQWLADKSQVHSLVIATTSDSSRRVTAVLPAIVAGLSSGSEDEFRRDQNKALGPIYIQDSHRGEAMIPCVPDQLIRSRDDGGSIRAV